MPNIYATLIGLNGQGILIRGKSGSGKSDLALRMIMSQGAKLIADDRVDLSIRSGKLIGSVPENIKGKLEVRGVGIIDLPYIENIDILLVVDLVEKNEIQRIPLLEKEEILGVEIDKLKIFPFECSAGYKIFAKISSIIS